MSKTVVITGASRGIGLALVKKFIERGDKVTALCRKSTTDLEATCAEVIEGIDVAQLSSLSKLREHFQGKKIDILINNAGVMDSELIEDFSEAAFEKMRKQFEVNTLGPLRVTSTLLDSLSEGSKVAMITSRMGSIEDNTSGKKYGYRMSKVALNMAAVSMAQDLAPRKIAVGIYHPGWVQTDMTGHSGQLTTDQCASNLLVRISELDLSTSGQFFHSNGEKLPW
ncbi:MAG: SDR family oxidoreductase [Deltaproteobacteria bacterium]|nr:MAG: SDR family oxidoreductase [Deltaproteobacteria bacterium]